jgi:periplasmic protein TonB
VRPGSLPEFDTKTGTPRWVGAGVVVGLHVLVGWALMSGLARKALDVVRQPVEVAIIDEVKPPPPPPPPPPEPPKVVKLRDTPPPPAPAPPPKAFVPPPEVTPAPTPPAPAIQAVQAEPPPKQVEIKPPPPAPPAPPVSPVPPAPPPRAEVGLTCPGYAEIVQNTMAGAYDRYGVIGVVRVRMLVRGNQIVEVTPLSGPKEYHRLVTQSARRFKCQASGSDEVQVTFEISVRED